MASTSPSASSPPHRASSAASSRVRPQAEPTGSTPGRGALPGDCNCEVGFRIPANWQSKATVELGRPARPDERYLTASSAFAKGELLGCSFRPGMRVAQLLPELARRGITVQYRPEGTSDPNARVGADWIVTDVTPASATSAFVFATPTTPDGLGPGLNC